MMRSLIFVPVVTFLWGFSSAGPVSAAVINNNGTVANLYGTSVPDTITNNGTVTSAIYGNPDGSSDGGFNTIINTDTGMAGTIFGSWNEAGGSSGGSNSITNSGLVASMMEGSFNIGVGSSGGSNTIINSGTVGGWIDGSWNRGENSSGGANTITNTVTGEVFEIYGSYNDGAGSSGGSNSISNSGTALIIYGSANVGTGSSGGSNTITNATTGTAAIIYGSLNDGTGSSGGFNTITNSAAWSNILLSANNGSDVGMPGSAFFPALGIVGSMNMGDDSSGGSNRITNTVTGEAGAIYGSMNVGAGSSGGSNTITNAGTVITGSSLVRINAVGANASSPVAFFYPGSGVVGSMNMGDGSSGGSNAIINSGTVNIGGGIVAASASVTNINPSVALVFPASGIIGSVNVGVGSSGGSNSITNSGTVVGSEITFSSGFASDASISAIPLVETSLPGIVGSANFGEGSSGGFNSITNSGTVSGLVYTNFFTSADTAMASEISSPPVIGIIGSWNYADGSSGGDNSIFNSGTVEGDIYGSYNWGAGSTSTGNTIDNSGTVDGSVYGSYNDGTGASGGDDVIMNSGAVSGGIYGEDGNDTIVVVGGSTLGGVADGGSENDTLGLNNMGTLDGSLLGTTYLNFENLGIYGGSNTLTGAWDFSGDSTVYDGNLFVDGSLSSGSFTVERNGFASILGSVNSDTAMVYGHMNVNGSFFTDDLTVATGGLLNGSGQISGNVVNYGTISPGNSIGTLTVNGTLSFMSGSVYVVELAANGSSDLLNVSGSVQLQGGTVQTYLPRSLYVNGQSWRIISAGGGVSGAFGGLIDNLNSQTLDLNLRYSANQVLLEIARTPFASLGSNPNERGVGSGLDGLIPAAGGGMAALITAMDFDMNLSQIQNVLNALSPEMYTAFSAAGLQSMSVVDQATALRQADLHQRRELGFVSTSTSTVTGVERSWDLWTRALGSWSEQDSKDNYLGHSQDLSGIVAGADGMLSDWLRMGLYLGYSDSKLEWEETSHGGNMQGTHLGAYASADLDGFFLDASGGYAGFDNSASRDIRFDGFSARAGNDFDSSAWQGRLEGGYDFKLNNWMLSPVASVDYTRLEQDAFNERGADFLNLHLEENTSDSTASTLGVRFSGVVKNEQWQFLPRAELRWLHQLQDDSPSITANFVDYGASLFSVAGLSPVDDQGLLSLGLTAEYGKSLSLFISGALALADGYTSHQLSGGLSWRF